ncbi:hypothetical protein [Rufibacter roseolus]|uniref:hypothetical protein n=1 Tax=Rufibacter roseolus TaxID=2817375 RepID=UPI001B30766F|nr:hypothetical protein [Rufibacter roseolus]
MAQRLIEATKDGAMVAVPAAYEDGQDWETILGEDVFARLYLAASLFEHITDAQVQANATVLKAFWERKRILLITGNKSLDEIYKPGTIAKAEERLDAAVVALSGADNRERCFNELNNRRRQKASAEMGEYMRHQLANQLMRPDAIKLALAEGQAKGFEPAEAEEYLLSSLRTAGFAPVKTINQNPNLLLSSWTPGGEPLTGRPHTKVMGHDVYSLEEAGLVLYNALVAGDEKAARNLDTEDYLTNIAHDLKENDALLDIRDILGNRKLKVIQKRLSILYLLGPGMPFYVDEHTEAFTSPAQLLERASVSAHDFSLAEEAFKAGNLQIWINASATAEVKAALPVGKNSLNFREFLHKANPQFPLWISEISFATPAQLANFITHEEESWKVVYGSLSSGYLSPWLNAIGQNDILEKQAELARVLIGVGLEKNSEKARKLSVQALLEALVSGTTTPKIEVDFSLVELTGLSGEVEAARVITLSNTTGGYVRVKISMLTPLDGVRISSDEIFFDQRMPGQKFEITVHGNPILMPRDGQHTGTLLISSAYQREEVSVVAEAVFPSKEFIKFVSLSAISLGLIIGITRLLLEEISGAGYRGLLQQGALFPIDSATEGGAGEAYWGLCFMLLLVGLSYGFVRVLIKISKPKIS